MISDNILPWHLAMFSAMSIVSKNEYEKALNVLFAFRSFPRSLIMFIFTKYICVCLRHKRYMNEGRTNIIVGPYKRWIMESAS